MKPRIKAELERIRAKLRGLASRAVIKLVRDSLKTQGVQLNLLAGETTPDDVERFQQYGFTSVPLEGAEAIVLHIGGGRDHGIVVATEDRRYRLTALADGEVALYDDQGQNVHIKRDRIHVEGTDVRIVAGTVVEVNDTDAALIATDGVVHGLGIDPFTGSTYAALGSTSALLRTKK